MPIYTYRCPKHGNFDELRTIDQRNNVVCPQCQSMVTMVICPVATVDKKRKMGETREELFRNLGQEGFAEPDMWKGDKQHIEESYARTMGRK